MCPCDAMVMDPVLTGCEMPEEKGPLMGKILRDGAHAGIEFCLGELAAEPARILYIGGCRQRDIARKLAFLFPVASIALLDTCEEEAKRAQEDIHCRFQFLSSPIESLPMKDNAVDLTIIHNAFQFIEDWEQAIHQLGRITAKHLLFTHIPPSWTWRAFGKHLPGMDWAMATDTITVPEKPIPDRNTMLHHIYRYGKVQHQTDAYPWKMWMIQMKPDRQEKLILEPIEAK
jgi:trans-aconitate methyltransferase